jgi:hypothetical protein
MPIEIRELVIKAVIDNSVQQTDSQPQGRNSDERSRTLLVEEIVTQVLQALQENRNER